MTYALLILIAIMAATMVFLFVLSKTLDSIVCYFSGWVLFGALVIMGLMTAGEFSAHAKDLGAVRSATEIMEFANERVSELEKSFEKKYGVQAPTAALMNSDKPVEGVAKELATAVKDRSIAQKKLLGSKVRIEQRKLGWFGFVPAIMGDK
jgi:hypothetical protein